MTMHRREGTTPTRRAVMAGTGTLAVTALAGCLGGDGGESGGSGGGSGGGGGGYGGGGGGSSGGDGGSGGTAATSSGDVETLQNHPAADGIESQPRLGPDPFEAEAVIVAFEDPSCPRCAAFERETVPRIESELVEPGRASFVFRGYPVIYPWGEPATQALESTFARDADAHWALARHYFDEQSSFDSDNVLDRTETFLEENTDLDAAAVVADAGSMAHDAAVQVDLDAGMAAGAGRTTPHVFLFSNGEYVTKAAGSVSFSVVTNALGL